MNNQKKYTYKDLYMKFNVGYTTDKDRNIINFFTIIDKNIDKALKQAKQKINNFVDKNEKNPIIINLEFDEYCTDRGVVLIYNPDTKKWHEEEEFEKHIRNKKEDKSLDTSCWYINPFNANERVFNQNGDKVKLNTDQTSDDYKFFEELHLNQDNTSTECGTTRYTTVCPMLYECIVYGHNYRYGYIKNKTNSLTEAIICVRVEYTKLYPNDDPRKHK